MENAPIRAHLLPWLLTGHSRASPELRQGIAPSFFCRNRNKGKRKRMAAGTSEKLAQEGLRGNRDRLAVGLRVPRARMVGRSHRDRRTVGSRVPPTPPAPSAYTTIQTTGTVRHFKTTGEDCAPLSLPANKTGASKRGRADDELNRVS